MSLASRTAAATRALRLFYTIAQEPAVFDEYAGHLLLAFSQVATTSRDAALAELALGMGRERVAAWRQRWPARRLRLDCDTVMHEVMAAYAAERLSVPADDIRQDIARVLRAATTARLLYFDPLVEVAPRDVPEECPNGHTSPRGCHICAGCGEHLVPLSRYEIWQYALTNAFFCERGRLPLRVCARDLLAHLPHLRPFPRPGDPEHYSSVYAATHVVFTMNGYGEARLDPGDLPHEMAFLESSLEWALEHAETDTLAEIIESLVALGTDDHHPPIEKGRMLLLERQQHDGGWGDEGDEYRRFHNIWAAIDGLREFRWSS